MNSPPDGSGLRVMHSVIVNMDWHTQDVKRHARRHNKEDAVHALIVIIEEVVGRSSLSPSAIKLEVNAGHLALI